MYLAPPADFAWAGDIITNLAKERQPWGGGGGGYSHNF